MRPVSSSASSRVQSCAAREAMEDRLGLLPVVARRSRVARLRAVDVLREREPHVLRLVAEAPRDQRRDRTSSLRARAASACSVDQRASASSRAAARPRCRDRGGGRARGTSHPVARRAAARSRRGLTPLPPWTATPAGLSMARIASSSKSDRAAEMRRDARASPARPRARAACGCGRRPTTVLRGVHALAVDAHLAGAKDPVNMALRHALQERDQEVVDPLAGLVLGDLDMAAPRERIAALCLHRHAGYTIVLDFHGDARSGARACRPTSLRREHKSDGKRITRARRTRIPRDCPCIGQLDRRAVALVTFRVDRQPPDEANQKSSTRSRIRDALKYRLLK